MWSYMQNTHIDVMYMYVYMYDHAICIYLHAYSAIA